MKLFDAFFSKKSPKSNIKTHTIQNHLAEYVEFLISFFLNYEEVRTMYEFKNRPNNLNGIIDFALFLDITTNLPGIFKRLNTKELKDIVHDFVIGTINAIPELCSDFGEARVRQATERIMRYVYLLIDDLKKPETLNYQSVSDFLNEVFSGQITEEEETVIANMLTAKFLPVRALIFNEGF